MYQKAGSNWLEGFMRIMGLFGICDEWSRSGSGGVKGLYTRI